MRCQAIIRMYTEQRCGHCSGSGMKGSVELKDGEGGYVLDVEVLHIINFGSKGALQSNGLLQKALVFLPTTCIFKLFTGEGRGRIAFALGEGAI